MAEKLELNPVYYVIIKVSRSRYASARRTDPLYSFMKRHQADQTPEARWTRNEKTKETTINYAP